MKAVASGVAMAAALAGLGCTTAPRRAVDFAATEVDSAETVWGDEHAGLLVDADEWAPAPGRSVAAEVVGGSDRRSRVAAAAHGVAVTARSTQAGASGAVEWRGGGWLRHVAVGSVRPGVAEGALVGDPRSGGDVRPGLALRSEGLRLSTTSASWGTALGAGLVLAPGPLRVGAGAWGSRTDAAARAACVSLEHRGERAVIGVAYAQAASPRDPRRAATVFGARHGESAFLGAELAWARAGPRLAARAVMGSRREWSMAAVAAAPGSEDASRLTASRERWGAGVERRDSWARVSSRLGLSALTRRSWTSETRRRRVSWDGAWRFSGESRLELAARMTREVEIRAADRPFASTPAAETSDEWRVRATLRAVRALAPALEVENAYRVDLVGRRNGATGTMVTWQCSLRGASLDGRLSASAFALPAGQLAYAPNPGAVGASAVSAVSGGGATLSASMRLSLNAHARLGVSWTLRSPREGRVLVFAALDA